jgi:hypothetical protein
MIGISCMIGRPLAVVAATNPMCAIDDAPLIGLTAISLRRSLPSIVIAFTLRRVVGVGRSHGGIMGQGCMGQGRLREAVGGAICAPRAGPIVAHRPECSSAW